MSQGTGGVQRSVPQSGAGQRSTSTLPQQFYISTSQQAPVMISCSGNGGTPVITSSAFHSTGVPTVSVIQQPTPSADLYLCNTANNATDPPQGKDDGCIKKASIKILEDSYKELNSRQIKDSLSSFLPDIPGEFDSTDSSETKLRHLLDQRLIGNKEFHLLSGHALLGFRLLPGPLPEQYRIDPPSHESRSHHRKKKHKHRSIDKVGDEGSDLNPPSSKVKMPTDAYGFMKTESSSSLLLPPPSHGYISMQDRSIQQIQKVVPSGHVYSTPMTVVPASSSDPIAQLKKKKEKKLHKKDKDKKKKEKKKKKDKHHSLDPPTGPPQPPPHPPPYSLQ